MQNLQKEVFGAQKQCHVEGRCMDELNSVLITFLVVV